MTDFERNRKVNQILNRQRRKGIETKSMKEYKEALLYVEKNKDNIDYNEIIRNVQDRFLKDDDLSKMFDMRKKSNKQRLANIKKTMVSNGYEISNISNQDIIDYIENINDLVDNINVLENIASEQVGEIYAMSRKKGYTQNELIELINDVQNQTNTYDVFINTLHNLLL